MKKPRILLTNDDGIFAPGIKHLWRALKDYADLSIIAPTHEQSAVGLSITIRKPLQVQEVQIDHVPALAVTGTPADCVKLALSVLLNPKPDLVVSGINRGSNAGRNILYSGTVGGAIEAVMHDIPAIAFSTGDYYEPDYEVLEKYIPRFVEQALKHPLPHGTLLNVNTPTKDLKIKGVKLARQGLEFWIENPDERRHPGGHSYYWLGMKTATFDEHEESDIEHLKQGYITAAPIHVADLTDHDHLNRHKEIFESFFSEI